MRVDIVSIFPEYFGPLDLSLIGKARAAGLLDLAVHDLRDWTSDVHRTVDDTPYGGRPGVGMRPETRSPGARAAAGAGWSCAPTPGPGRSTRSPARPRRSSCPPRPASRSPRRTPIRSR